MMHVDIGTVVGPYKICTKIGKGGMATVYQAYHQNLDRDVAIKVLHPVFKDDDTFLHRFRREARVVARLEHPNIVPVYDFAEQDGTPYLVMKFVEGVTLKEKMSAGALDKREVVRVAQAVAGAVCGANLRILQSLVKKSLLGRDIENGRYTIHELLRQYAAEKLTASGQEAATREAHARYFAQLLGPLHETLYANTATQATEIIAAEYENGLLAWKWGVEQLNETVVIGIVFPLGVYSAWYLLEHMINQFDDAYERLEGRLQPRSWFMFLLVRLAVYVYVRHSSPDRGNAEQLIALLPGIRDQFGTDSEGLWTRYYIGMVLRATPDAREIVLEAIELAKKVENVWVERGGHHMAGFIEEERRNLEAALQSSLGARQVIDSRTGVYSTESAGKRIEFIWFISV